MRDRLLDEDVLFWKYLPQFHAALGNFVGSFTGSRERVGIAALQENGRLLHSLLPTVMKQSRKSCFSVTEYEGG